MMRAAGDGLDPRVELLLDREADGGLSALEAEELARVAGGDPAVQARRLLERRLARAVARGRGGEPGALDLPALEARVLAGVGRRRRRRGARVVAWAGVVAIVGAVGVVGVVGVIGAGFLERRAPTQAAVRPRVVASAPVEVRVDAEEEDGLPAEIRF